MRVTLELIFDRIFHLGVWLFRFSWQEYFGQSRLKCMHICLGHDHPHSHDHDHHDHHDHHHNDRMCFWSAPTHWCNQIGAGQPVGQEIEQEIIVIGIATKTIIIFMFFNGMMLMPASRPGTLSMQSSSSSASSWRNLCFCCCTLWVSKCKFNEYYGGGGGGKNSAEIILRIYIGNSHRLRYTNSFESIWINFNTAEIILRIYIENSHRHKVYCCKLSCEFWNNLYLYPFTFVFLWQLHNQRYSHKWQIRAGTKFSVWN